MFPTVLLSVVQKEYPNALVKNRIWLVQVFTELRLSVGQGLFFIPEQVS